MSEFIKILKHIVDKKRAFKINIFNCHSLNAYYMLWLKMIFSSRGKLNILTGKKYIKTNTSLAHIFFNYKCVLTFWRFDSSIFFNKATRNLKLVYKETIS